MNTVTTTLKLIYAASQCTDLNDCEIAIEQLKTFARNCRNSYYTPAMRRRLASLEKRKEKFI